MKTAPTQLSADRSRSASAARAEDLGGGKHVRPLMPVASLPPRTFLSVLRWGQGRPTAGSHTGCLGTRLGLPVSSQRRKSLSSVKLPGTLTSNISKNPHEFKSCVMWNYIPECGRGTMKYCFPALRSSRMLIGS